MNVDTTMKCDICGGIAAFQTTYLGRWQVVCPNCGNIGFESKSMDGAARAWNAKQFTDEDTEELATTTPADDVFMLLNAISQLKGLCTESADDVTVTMPRLGEHPKHWRECGVDELFRVLEAKYAAEPVTDNEAGCKSF